MKNYKETLKLNTCFRVVSTDERFEIVNIVTRQGQRLLKEPLYVLRYTNRDYEDIRITAESILRQLNFETWVIEKREK